MKGLEGDRTAMMLGLVPDKRTPEQRLEDAVRTNGESLNYRYDCPSVSAEGHPCDRHGKRHDSHEHLLPCGCTATWAAVVSDHREAEQ